MANRKTLKRFIGDKGEDASVKMLEAGEQDRQYEKVAAELANLTEDPDVIARDRMIPGPDGAPDVKIRIYEPKNRGDRLLPCLFFYHGGGFLFGTVYRQEKLCQGYVKNVDCIVVSVEYRLAPQWKAPAPLMDCYAALTWVHDHGTEIGVDSSRLAVSGLSAGGNLADGTYVILAGNLTMTGTVALSGTGADNTAVTDIKHAKTVPNLTMSTPVLFVTFQKSSMKIQAQGTYPVPAYRRARPLRRARQNGNGDLPSMRWLWDMRPAASLF